MNKFFVPKDIYKDRIAICKGCTYYSSVLGNCKICKCFMKVKSRIAPMECPKKYWLKTSIIEARTDIPEEIIEEVLLVWPEIKTGRAKNKEANSKMIELYNIIYGSNYSPTSNCSSCIAACFDGITKIYRQYTSNN